MQHNSYCGIANPYTPYGRIANPTEHRALAAKPEVKSDRTQGNTGISS